MNLRAKKSKIVFLQYYINFGIQVLDKPEPDPKPVDLDLDLICETRLDLDLDFKNNLDLDLDISNIRTDPTLCHPYLFVRQKCFNPSFSFW